LGARLIVADTNLIAYLLIETEQTPHATACGKRDPNWVAPPVWRHEFMNVLCQHVRLRGLPVETALTALAAADRFIETVTLRGLDEQIVRWAADHATSSYDAQFAVLAEKLDAPLVTADKGLLRHLRHPAVTPVDFANGKP
jgi:predicted nucleic acid-binding protein